MEPRTLYLMVSLEPDTVVLLRGEGKRSGLLSLPSATFTEEHPPAETVVTLLNSVLALSLSAEDIMPYLQHLGTDAYAYHHLVRLNLPLLEALGISLTQQYPRKTGSKAEYLENTLSVISRILDMDGLKRVPTQTFWKMVADGSFGFQLRMMAREMSSTPIPMPLIGRVA